MSVADEVPAPIRQVRSGLATFETEHVAKDGRRIPVEVAASLINVGGVPTILSIARDMTERKLASERLAKARAAITEVVSLVSETRDPYTAGHQRRICL